MTSWQDRFSREKNIVPINSIIIIYCAKKFVVNKAYLACRFPSPNFGDNESILVYLPFYMLLEDLRPHWFPHGHLSLIPLCSFLYRPASLLSHAWAPSFAGHSVSLVRRALTALRLVRKWGMFSQ